MPKGYADMIPRIQALAENRGYPGRDTGADDRGA